MNAISEWIQNPSTMIGAILADVGIALGLLLDTIPDKTLAKVSLIATLILTVTMILATVTRMRLNTRQAEKAEMEIQKLKKDSKGE